MPASVVPSLYVAEYFKNGFADLTATAPLKGVSATEYWDIKKISGSDAQVQLTLNAAVIGASAGDGIVVADHVGGSWISEHGSVLSPGSLVVGSVLSKKLSSFSSFTFGYAGSADLNITAGNGLSYKYYQGNFTSLPDFNAMVPVLTGTSANVDIRVRSAGVEDGFAFIWQGNINIPTAGVYTFETISDDGSKLYFNTPYHADATALVNNDGIHPLQSATGTVTVTAAGNYPVTITYFQNYGGKSVQVFWSGAGIPRQLIPNAAFSKATPVAAGLFYQFYHGPFSSLPDFSTLTPLKTGNSNNVDISARPAGADDGFAFMWKGFVTIPAAGMYTFETVSDDGSKLYFNTPYNKDASALVNNDGTHSTQSSKGTVNITTAGVYPITITYFDNYGDQKMQVYWSAPGLVRQQVPDAAFSSVAPAVASNGLNFRYYESHFNILPDFSALTPLKKGVTNKVDIGIRPSGVNDGFAFIWDGYINLPSAGTYTFETISDDGSKVYFNMPYSQNGSSLVKNDGLHPATSSKGTVTVPAAGKYPVAITYFEKDGGEQMEFYWTGPGIARQLVPSWAFTATNDTGGTAVMAGKETGSFIAAEAITGTTRVYPNPFVDNLSIDYFHSGGAGSKVTIGIYDVKGRLLYSYLPAELVAGYNKWIINLGSERLTAGIYIAKLNINGIPASTIKLMKLKR